MSCKYSVEVTECWSVLTIAKAKTQGEEKKDHDKDNDDMQGNWIKEEVEAKRMNLLWIKWNNDGNRELGEK